MLNNCCLCDAHDVEKFSTTSEIVNLLEILIKFLQNKEKQDCSKLLKLEQSLEYANQTNDELKTSNQELSSSVTELNNLLEAAQYQSENYKQKFLEVQRTLTELKKVKDDLNYSAIQSQTGAAALATEQCDVDELSVMYSSTSCFPQSPPDGDWRREKKLIKLKSYRNSIPLKSEQNQSIRKFFSPVVKSNPEESLAHEKAANQNQQSSDPNETGVDKDLFLDNDDDRESLIPDSPVLSSKLNSSKRPNCDEETINDSRGSPSLLHSIMPFKFPLNNVKKNSKNNTTPFQEITSNQSDLYNDSLPIHDQLNHDQSPRQCKEPNSCDQTMADTELYLSIDELFNKTDGDLYDVSSPINTDVEHRSVLLSDEEDDCMENNPSMKHSSINSNINKTSSNRSPQPGYKYQSVVKKRSDKQKLNADTCVQCNAYYSDLPDGEREKIIQEVCRHRYQFSPPSTPTHFWEVGIPSTAECKRRGYMLNEDDLPSDAIEGRRRRKKPYQAHFPTKH